MSRYCILRCLAVVVVLLSALPCQARQLPDSGLAVPPREAFPQVAELKEFADAVNYEPAPAEFEMLDRFESGNEFSERQWADAFLIAAGESDSATREKHIAQIDRIENEIRESTAGLNLKEKAERINVHIHDNVMSGGYVEQQSSLGVLLETGKYNCVSALTLYHLLCRRLGIENSMLEFPGTEYKIGHVMTLVIVDDNTTVDVEPTDKDGFDIRRKVDEGGGFALGINDLESGQPMNTAGLLRSVYNNRTSAAQKSEQYFDALQLSLMVLATDPGVAKSQEGFCGSFMNWIKAETDAEHFENAMAIAAIGMQIAPGHEGIANNLRVTFQKLALKKIADDQDSETAELFLNAEQKWPQHAYGLELSNIYQVAAQTEKKNGDWKRALEILARGIDVAEDENRNDLKETRNDYFRSWSNAELKGGNFDAAIAVLQNAMTTTKSDEPFFGDTEYLTQEILRSVDQDDGSEKAIQWFITLKEKFPAASSSIDKMAANHLQRLLSELYRDGKFEQARIALKERKPLISDQDADEVLAQSYQSEASELREKDWQSAIDVLEGGIAVTTADNQEKLVSNRNDYFRAWANAELMAGNYDAAIAVLQNAMTTAESDEPFLRDVDYLTQEILKNVDQPDGAEKAIDWVSKLKKQFPGATGIDDVASAHVNRRFYQCLDAGQYQQARETLQQRNGLITPEKMTDSIAQIYDTQARPLMDQKQWKSAIELYQAGLKECPDHRLLKQNLAYCEQFLDK